jgi:uncharacterized repeat protein (TIGR03803 family)
MTPSGALTSVYTFCSLPNCSDGDSPHAGLVQATDGSFYGTTWVGGGINVYCVGGCGIVFKLSPSGALTTLHKFDYVDGASPSAALLQAVDGMFYGTTYLGG